MAKAVKPGRDGKLEFLRATGSVDIRCYHVTMLLY